MIVIKSLAAGHGRHIDGYGRYAIIIGYIGHTGHSRNGVLLQLEGYRLTIFLNDRRGARSIMALRNGDEGESFDRFVGGDEKIFLGLLIEHAGIGNAVDLGDADKGIIG